jgi:GLPGLI family protein
MKRILLPIAIFLSTGFAFAQRVMTEGTIQYDVVATSQKAQEATNTFNGATLTVYIKGNNVLQELKSNLLNQAIIYNGKSDTAIILKQAGEQKFIVNMNAADWQQYNRRFESLNYTMSDSSKTVAGYLCKQATATLTDGTEITVYYATTLVPFVKGYDYQFKSLPGLALEYTVKNAAMQVKYTASKVLFNPVPAFKFDVPKSGYRILDYKSSQ